MSLSGWITTGVIVISIFMFMRILTLRSRIKILEALLDEIEGRDEADPDRGRTS